MRVSALIAFLGICGVTSYLLSIKESKISYDSLHENKASTNTSIVEQALTKSEAVLADTKLKVSKQIDSVTPQEPRPNLVASKKISDLHLINEKIEVLVNNINKHETLLKVKRKKRFNEKGEAVGNGYSEDDAQYDEQELMIAMERKEAIEKLDNLIKSQL